MDVGVAKVVSEATGLFGRLHCPRPEAYTVFESSLNAVNARYERVAYSTEGLRFERNLSTFPA